MSMLLKALESVERDRNRKEKERSESGGSGETVATDKRAAGDVPASEALEYFKTTSEKRDALEPLPDPESEAAAGLEKLEFQLEPDWDAGVEKKAVSDAKGSSGNASGESTPSLDFDLETGDEPETGAAGPAAGGGLIASLAAEGDGEISGSERPAADAGLISSLAFEEDGEEGAESEAERPSAGGSLIASLAFEDDGEEGAESEPEGPSAGGSLIASLAIEEDEEGGAESEPEGPSAGGSLISSLAFEEDEEEGAESEPEGPSGGGSLIASLAFADEEEEEAGSAPEKPASGGKLISALAFDLDEEGDEDEEEGTVMAPAGTSYTPPAAAAPAPVAPVAPPAPAAPVAPPAPAAPVTPPVAPAAPAAPVMPETDQGDGDEKPDVTFPTTFRQGATPSALSGAASPGMDAGMGDEADQDDWDASGALDNTVDFQAYLLSEADQAPAKEEPPIQGAAFTREKPPEPTATAATADTMVAGTPEAAQNIFDAVSETPPSPWKKWAIIGGSLAAVALFSVMGYQYAELSGLLKTPAMRGFTARVAEWVPFVDPPKPVRPPRRPVAVRPSIPLQPAVKPPAAVRAPLAPAVMEKSPVRESAALVPRSSPPSRAETPAAPVAPAAAPAVPKAPPVSEVLRQPSTVAEKPVPPADRRPAAPRIDTHQRLMMARNAFYSGRGDRARALYDEVLRLDDTNRDALMGLAALGVSDGRYGKAAGYYMRLLELDPRDSVALAGLTSLSGNIDAQNQESRIKAILQGEPNAPHLYFALGGLYAAQSRWSEAQHVFFKALSGDDTNADFAFNLAVSLDHLGQERAALPYYRRALALATLRPGRFDAGSVKARVADLSRELDNRAAGVAAGPLE